MIIQCEKCSTKFRLDDSKVTDKGVKVRCAKCKHVFTVRNEETEEAPFNVDEPSSADMAFSAGSDEANSTFEESSFAPEPADGASTGASLFGDAPAADYSSFETSSFDSSSISFEDELDVTGTEEHAIAAPSQPAAGEVDFSGFDFGDSVAEPDQAPSSNLSLEDFTDEAPAPAAPPLRKEAPQGLDFSDDDMFGAVVESAPEPTTDTITFDFGEDSFAESMDAGSVDSGKSGTTFSLDPPAETPFNLGEIDFGDELTSVAVQQVNPDDLKPSQELLFAPLAAAQIQEQTDPEDDELARSLMGEESSADLQQELPPLSIASRRKQSPLFTGVIAVVALLVVSVLGYLGYSSFSSPKEAATQESGKISVRGVKAAFVANDEAGELLVVSGEALNEYAKPRAALQVKVTVFDSTGQSVASKSAYGGNPLTDEQLQSMPLDKIEAAMANQFGDSLANMEVAPGKAIPFVVVLAKLPKGAKDFGVQPVGSTVATGKQQ